MNKIYYSSFESRYGRIFVAASSKGAVRITAGRTEFDGLLSWLEDHFPGYVYEEDEEFMKKYISQVKDYIAGKKDVIDIPVDLRLNGFTRKALMALRRIPFGCTLTYAELAAKAGNPRAARAAGTACSKNPLPFVIPCHRVVASGNRLGGYGGGEKFKLELLQREGVTNIKT